MPPSPARAGGIRSDVDHGDHLYGLGSARSRADSGFAQGRRSHRVSLLRNRRSCAIDAARPALQGDSAVVSEEFLIRLNAQVGDNLRLGGRDFRIAAVLEQEPDRISEDREPARAS